VSSLKANSQRFLPIIGALAFTLWNSLPASAQALPPTLTGEHLTAMPNITTSCNPSGTSTVTFSASGVAAGPYPGTFTEVGTATIGPQTVSPEGGSSHGTLLTFNAAFTIHSAVGDATGTKTLAFPVTNPATQVAIGQCNTFQNVELEDAIDRFTVRYEARISTLAGEFADRGLVPLVAVQRVLVFENPVRITFDSFIEDFASDLTATQPLTSPGKATGGGQIPSAFGADPVTFGFTAQSTGQAQMGTCEVVDHAAATKVKCLDVTGYFQSGNRATFVGHATVNGVDTLYRIDVTETGEPGAGRDSFAIQTASGYAAAGVLLRGNIQVHPAA